MVKKGYKQTEVGVLPEDWAIKKLINLSDGGMQNGTFYEGSRKGNGVYFLNVGNLYQAAPIIPQTLGKFDASKDEIDRFRVKNGDLFFTRSSIVPSGIAYCNWYKDSGDNTTVFDSHVVRFKTDTDQVNPMYLYLQCVSQESRKYFISNAKVATMTTIDQAQIGNCLIPVPSLTEQKNIAEAISDADRIIRLLEKLIIKKKAIKQGAMQELLTGKRRLPGFSGNWQTISLKKALSVGHGMSQHDVACPTGRYPILATGGVIGQANRYLWNAPSVLIGRKGTINKPQYMDKPFWSIDTLFYTKINEGYCPKFLYYVFCRIDWLSYNEASGVPSLSSKTIESIEVQVPDYREQCAIAGALTDIDTEIEALEQKSGKYRQVKQGMMQQLLTGKIRLM